MGVPGNANALLLRSAAAAGGYQVSRSLRFNSSDSAYLSRTPSSAGNRRTWTLSLWVKRANLGAQQKLLSVNTASDNNNAFNIDFNSSDRFSITASSGGADILTLTTTQVFRDVSAWYHILLSADTTQSTASNRLKLYVNGQQVTVFTTASYPAQNTDLRVNNNEVHYIGRLGYTSVYCNAYLADIHLIDGSALDPSSFTEVSATTGQLVPKQYSGSFGTNGFKLNFSDNSAATAAALGKDTANSNNWTPNNFSVTAGAGNDSLVDTPTSYGTDTGAGGEVRGNYATLNPLNNRGLTLSDGNLKAANVDTQNRHVRSTIPITTGKFYWEITATAATPDFHLGISTVSLETLGSGYLGSIAGTWGYWPNTSGSSIGYWRNAGSNVYTDLPRAVTNDVIMFAVDASAGRVWVGINGTWFKSGNPASGTNALSTNLPTDGTPIFPHLNQYDTTGSYANFGQRAFAYTAPSGFKALCDTNLPTPVVAKPNTVMDVKLYTGNGSTQTISGLGFSPDLVWIKNRADVESHGLFDQVRGADLWLSSNTTGAETDYGGGFGVTTFTSTGFTVGNGTAINRSGAGIVAWTWDAGSSTVTNTQGSITSSVRANASAGFSVVTWTGQTAAGSIGHGLNAAPSLIICKARSNAQSWGVYHKDVGINNYLLLDSTGASTAYSGIWGSSAPTSTVFSVPGNVGLNNNNGWTYVGYCFAPVAGYSSFGSYVGNGTSGDGVFVYTGFRVRWLLIKQSSAAGEQWFLLDSARSPYNIAQEYLCPSASFGETSAYNIVDFLSNGFKLRATGSISSFNGSGATYIYAAFAESPFQFSRAR